MSALSKEDVCSRKYFEAQTRATEAHTRATTEHVKDIVREVLAEEKAKKFAPIECDVEALEALINENKHKGTSYVSFITPDGFISHNGSKGKKRVTIKFKMEDLRVDGTSC